MRLCPTGNKSINTLTLCNHSYGKPQNLTSSDRKEQNATFYHLNYNLCLRVYNSYRNRRHSVKPPFYECLLLFFRKSGKALVLWGWKVGVGVLLHHPPTIRQRQATACLDKVALLSIDKQKASCYSLGIPRKETQERQEATFT